MNALGRNRIALRRALAMLPTASAEDVAAFLRTRRVRGRVERICDCPLARWLSKTIGTSVVVTPPVACLSGDLDDEGAIPLPEAADEFTRLFDLRMYPDMIEKEKA